MAKPYSVCKVCGTKRFLNFAGLCTKCNKNVSREIVENALGKKHDMQESKAEMEALQAEKLKEKQTLEEMDELTSEQKEGEKEGKKTDEETKEEKPDEK